ncbi:peptidoglycan DD-metalloendopeptidase family protein [Arthrobacter sp. AK04]|uniref:M23 family metallopeptidase n=1 Tax=Arthrobacter sp. AK04 TaxID=2900048 RepID=UPI0027E018A9|nr:peptidoglycan DD-metalloendopeptidase family protein [Arthrobacter sp. AK04]
MGPGVRNSVAKRNECGRRRLLLLPSKSWLSVTLTAVVLCCASLPATAAVGTDETPIPSKSVKTEGSAGIEGSAPQERVQDAVVADSAGFLYFERVDVESIGADGSRRMRVASRGLGRPPAGWLLAPLEVLNLSSSYGSRINPLTGAAGEFHWGQDFGSACGTRVYSADSGVARAVGWHPWGGGNRVEIDHGNGIISTYNHLESTAVEQGESVKVGEVIAHVGTTGSSTGCHLHFETLVKGIHTDPSNWELLPISQLDQLEDLPRNRFDPGIGSKTERPIVWAIPANRPVNRHITGGELEAPAPEPRVPDPEPRPCPSGFEPGPGPEACVPVSPEPRPCPSGFEPGPGPEACVPVSPEPRPCPSGFEPGPGPEACVPVSPEPRPCPPGPAPGPVDPAPVDPATVPELPCVAAEPTPIS